MSDTTPMVDPRDIVGKGKTTETLALQDGLAALTTEVSLSLARGGPLSDTLRCCAEALVHHIDAAFARVWTLNTSENVLELQASAGMYTRLDGTHGRVPVGDTMIGHIAQSVRPYLTNDVMADGRVRDPEWARREGMVAFAGYPLIVEARLVGVVAIFSRKPLTELTIQAVEWVANAIAIGIERKRVEAALRESEMKYRSLFENNLSGLAYQKLLVDEENRPIDYVYLEVNDAFKKLSGCEPEHMIGRKVTDLVPGIRSWNPDPISVYGRVALTGEGASFEQHAEDMDVWYSVSAYSPARGYFVTQYADITERKKSEEELIRLRKAVESSGEVIFLTDREGIITYVNPEFTRVYGYSAEEVVGKRTPRVLKSGLMKPEDYALFWAVILSGQTVKGEFANKTKDGRLLNVEGSANPIVDERGGIIGFLSVQRDITKRKATELALQGSLEKLHRTMEGAVQAMALIVEMRDPYTAGHQQRVARLSYAIAEEVGLAQEQAEVIRLAGIVHDIGKISIPAEILSKPGRLSEIEFNLVRAHCETGHGILSTIEFTWPIAQIVLQHHERIDGSGYPAGLTRDEIALDARILGVADVVEAMASHRPYRAALGIDEALAEISKNRGILYDPGASDACLRLFREKGFRLTQQAGTALVSG